MLKVAVLFMTPRCNLHCDFCGAEAGFDVASYDDAALLLEKLAFEKVGSVVFGGGEPMLWPHGLPALSRHARSLGLISQIGTNGSLAPEDDADLFDFDRWILPMESLDDSVHNRLRQHPGGHLHHVTALLQRLKQKGIAATISSLVSRENFDQLTEVGAYLSRYQAHGGRLHAWHLYSFLPQGRSGAANASRFATSDGIFASLGSLLRSRFPELKIYLRPDMYHSKNVSFYWWQDGELKVLESEEKRGKFAIKN